MLINRVKNYRKGAGLTQEDLALLAGVSRQTIISIEKNKFVPGLDIAIRISESLKTPINKLFYFINEKIDAVILGLMALSLISN